MPHEHIKDSLLRFNAAVKSGDRPGLSAALNELEAQLAAHRDQLHPQLLHFLEGRSYAKALSWLGGTSEFGRASSPPGGCGDH